MREQLTEALEIVDDILDSATRHPPGLVRVRRLLTDALQDLPPEPRQAPMRGFDEWWNGTKEGF